METYKVIELSNDLSAVVSSDLDAPTYNIIRFVVEYYDKKTNKPLIRKNINTSGQAILNLVSVFNIAETELDDYELTIRNGFMDTRSAREMREIAKELGDWINRDEPEEDDEGNLY